MALGHTVQPLHAQLYLKIKQVFLELLAFYFIALWSC